MKRTVIAVACFSAILFTFGCALMDMGPDYEALTKDLNVRFYACLAARMTKSEVLMQAGLPTAKEVVENGEIWIFQLTENGVTESTTTYEPGNIFEDAQATTTTQTPQYKALITLRFNSSGEMVDFNFSGQNGALHGNNRIKTLRPPQR